MRRVWTDGSCLGNPGPGGWAYVEEDGPLRRWGFEPSTTNQRMELMAVARATELGPVHCLTDSMYVVRGVVEWSPGWEARGWRKGDGSPVLHSDLWRVLRRAADEGRLGVEWVRGHAGLELNEEADALASWAARHGGSGSRGEGGLRPPSHGA